jgi:hypothetical protein
MTLGLGCVCIKRRKQKQYEGTGGLSWKRRNKNSTTGKQKLAHGRQTMCSPVPYGIRQDGKGREMGGSR